MPNRPDTRACDTPHCKEPVGAVGLACTSHDTITFTARPTSPLANTLKQPNTRPATGPTQQPQEGNR